MGKISDYTRVLVSKLTDVFACDQTDNGTTETKSATVEQIGTAIGTLQNFASLDTSNKNLVDAINEIASYTPVYGNTASGAIATFDTSLALPLQDLQIAINAVQESGTPTPSSPKLISGFTGANIQRCNNAFASLWDIDSSFKGSVVWNQLRRDDTTTNTADGITTEYDGTTHLVSITNNSRTSNYSSGSTQITLSNTAPIENHVYAYLANTDEQGISISQTNGNALRQTDVINTVFKGVSGATGFRLRVTNLYDFVSAHPINNTFSFYLNIIDLTQMFGTAIADYIYGLEQANAGAGVAFFKSLYPDDYYAYDSGTSELVGDTIATISWQDEAGTVYGGSDNPISGKLIDTWYGMKLNAITPTYNSSYGFFAYYNTQIPVERKVSSQNIKCECYAVYPNYISSVSQIANLPDKTIYYQNNSAHFFIKDTDYTDATAFVNGVGDNLVIYERATPVTYQLTPTQISAIVGTNNVFTDTNGDTSVVYACSLKDYIDSQ